jgi:2-polyprenyl-3-methyl-5-hydroxy-6-metoxy-1,4-benzoquinol methylase
MSLKSGFQMVRAAGTRWLPALSMDHQRAIREYELRRVVPFLAQGARVLEVGAGAGWQAVRLKALGYDVEAVDIEDSNYRAQRVFPVRTYDGRHLPFDDGTFDCVFSSNVLEHVKEPALLHADLQRVLRRGGVAVHVVPSSTWVLWTMLGYPVRYWRPAVRHGEQASFAAQELVLFSRRRWRRAFEANGWHITHAFGVGLFYTGVCLLDRHLSIAARQRLAKVLGSASHVFVMGRRDATMSDGTE